MAIYLVTARREFLAAAGLLFLFTLIACSAPELDTIADRNSEENVILNFLLSQDRGPRLSVSSLSFREGETGVYLLSMERAPSGTAIVEISFDPAQVSVNGRATSPVQVSFDPTNWRTAQTVSVFALDDAVPGGTRAMSISHTLSGRTEGLSSPGNVDVTILDDELRIFVTSTTMNGRIEVNGTAGIAGADLLCMTDAAYPGSGVYRALIADGVTRRACFTANCGSSGTSENIDWVLRANTNYHRLDGTFITATGSGTTIITANLTNPIGTSNLPVWTGIETSWETTAGTDTCAGFTSSAASPNRCILGRANSVDSLFIRGTVDQGTSAGHVYCVEQ